MHEYVTVSSSSYDPASLAAKLTEKSAEGWTVVAIVPTGGDVTAFLSREGTGAASTEAAPAVEEAAPVLAAAAVDTTPEPEPEPEPVSEPAGWAVAPAAVAEATPEPTPEPEPVVAEPVVAAAAADSAYQPAAAAPAATPAVPAGWYADPAGRFELRYWDGGTWTEHVSRGGQQYTDAPVA